MEDWYWICSGQSIGRTGTGSIVDRRVYRGLVLDLSRLLIIRRYWICAGLQSIGRTCTESEVDSYIIQRAGTEFVVDCT